MYLIFFLSFLSFSYLEKYDVQLRKALARNACEESLLMHILNLFKWPGKYPIVPLLHMEKKKNPILLTLKMSSCGFVSLLIKCCTWLFLKHGAELSQPVKLCGHLFSWHLLLSEGPSSAKVLRALASYSTNHFTMRLKLLLLQWN